jgi:hypothetical protein
MKLQHKFVEFIPDLLEDGMLYISLTYCTAIHKCVCGCNNEVVTPISPTDWKMTFDGETISLFPSIGNWNFECKSHYFIIRNMICLARRLEKWKVKESYKQDLKNKKKYFNKKKRKNN